VIGGRKARATSVRILAGVAVAGVLVVSSGAAALAQTSPPTTTEAGKCVKEKTDAGKPAEDCLKAPNPILPKGNEIVWGTISFLVLFALLAKKGYPAVKKGMDARAKKIKDSLDEAESTRTEAQSILEQYRSQLNDAKNESARIIEEARQAADKLRQDLKRQAESEVAEVKSRAEEDIATQVERAKADLQARVAELSIELAEKVVERSLDRETNMALIESFIRETEGAR
jgi:F-type H+-transporting ATPase subunit b